MKKKLLGILFVLGLLLALPSMVSFAATKAKGTCGATGEEIYVEWALDDNGNLTISHGGNGTAMADYASANEVPWKDSIAAIETVTIRDNVTGIGAYAFSGCTSLNSVTISRKVTKIGNNAFENCTNLTDVYYAGTKDDWDGVNKGNINDCLTKVNISYCVCGANGNEANVKWSLDNDTLTISGSGAMESYNLGCTPWYASKENIQIVVIKEGVTEIGPGAFLACSNLQSVTIPDSVESIGAGTFWGCSNLQSVTIPKKVTSIGTGTFNSCTNLTSVKIPDDVKNIGDNAFYGCTSLTSVTIPASVTSIGNNAFLNCTKLTDVYYTGTKEQWDGLNKNNGNDSLTNATLHYHCGATADDNVYWALVGDTLTISGSGAMADYADASSVPWNNSITAIKTVGIEDGVTNVGNNAFNGCTKLTSVTISKDATKIGFYAFRDCTSLKSVTIPDEVQEIYGFAFFGCKNLTSVTIPKNVVRLVDGAFAWCSELETAYIPIGLSGDSIGTQTTKLYYIAGAAEGNITPVTIDSVTYGHGKEDITLPCDIMGNGYVIQSAKENIGVKINHKSSEVYMPEGSEIYTPITGNNLATKCKICNGVVTTSGPIDPYANLVISETVAVGESEQLPVTAISGGYTESGYTTVTVPKDVKYISKGAFYTNENLDTIYLPEGCQMESESVPLTTKIVYYKVNKDERGNAVVRTSSTGEEITQVTVSRVDVLKPDQELNLNNIYGKYEITAIDDDALDNSGKNLHTVILPNSVESINARVFENCKNLETIYLKEGCTIANEGNIADKNLIYYTDDGATISSAKINIDNFQLELSQIRNGIGLKIGENAFKDQVKMKSVTIPATVTSIDAQAFAGCTKLTSIDIPASVTSIGTNPFAGCTGLQTIAVEEGNTAYKIENGVLFSKDGETLVCYLAGNAGTTYTTPESVTAIAAQAFADCKNLENVVLRETVTSVGADAFTGCDKLMAVYAQKDCDIDSTVLNSENIIYYIVTNEDVSSKKVTIGKTTEDYNDSLAGGQNCIINRAGTELDLNVLNNTGLYKITCIGAGAFYQEASKQHNLKSIIIPEGVTTVNGRFLKYSQGLESVKLPTTLTSSLPKHSITDNVALKTLTIPHQVTNIDSEAFTATTGLETVYVPSTITDITPITNNSTKANIIYYHTPTEGEKGRYPEIFGEGNEVCIGKYEFGNVGGTKKEYFESHDSSIINREHSVIDLRTMDSNYQIKLICMAAFSRSEDEDSKKDYIEKIIVPEGVIHIDQCAFRWNHGLLSITLPTTLNPETTMQKYSITDNETLQTLVIPHGVTAINRDALCQVTGLNRVYVPDVETFNVAYITNYSKDATIIKYKVTDGTVSPKKVKITGASAKVDVYCDEMGDRYVITGNNSSSVTLKHRGDVEVPAKEATCEENGTKAYWKCLCGGRNCTEKDSETKVENLTIAATGHTSLSEVPAKAATFHACGVKAHYKCNECGEIFSNETATIVLNDATIPEHQGHNFGAYSHDYENQALHADVCALKGTVAATCAICDQTDVKSCAEHTKSSHVWTKGEKIPATCKTTGTQAYTCSLCNESETKTLEIDPNNHTKEHITEVAATCTEAGNNEYWHCEICDKYFKNEECTQETSKEAETIKALGHTKEHITEVAATCTEAGNDEYWYCGGCKKYFEDEACTTEITDISEVTRPATGHTNVEKTEAKAATCTEAGNDEYWYCGGCKKYFEDEACTTETNISKLTRPATGHTYGEVEYTWSNDYGNCTAKRVCQNDTSHVETENATKITENIIKAATCEGVGKKTYKAEFNSFTSCETEELDIPATGHKCNDTWEHNETQHWKVCETCEKEVNAANHTDENSDGTCDVCGYVTTPDTYTVSGTVYTWDNTDSNTTRVRLYDSTASEDDIKSDIQHDITDKSYTKTCQYDATVEGPETATKGYTQSFEFTGVANGNYKLAAWRPAYNISSKHYAYVLRVDSIDISETLANNKIELMLYGDITNTGNIGAAGAITIARYRANDSRSLLLSDKTSEYQKKAMDLNDDGNYNAYESICIARHRANIDSPFNQHI